MTHLLNGNDIGKHIFLFLFVLQFPIYSSSVDTNFLLLKYYVAFLSFIYFVIYNSYTLWRLGTETI